MRKGDSSLNFAEDGLDLCTSEDEEGAAGPASPVATAVLSTHTCNNTEEEAAAAGIMELVEDWLCLEASGPSCNASSPTLSTEQNMHRVGQGGDPWRAHASGETQQPRSTWLAVLLASLPPAQRRKRSEPGCRWALTGEFLHAMALRMPLLRAAAALGISAAALRAACRRVGMRSWDHRSHAAAARAVKSTRSTNYLFCVRRRLLKTTKNA